MSQTELCFAVVRWITVLVLLDFYKHKLFLDWAFGFLNPVTEFSINASQNKQTNVYTIRGLWQDLQTINFIAMKYKK